MPNLSLRNAPCRSLWTRTALFLTLTAGSLAAANSYLVHNLVSDLPNIADHQDAHLVNPWGIGFSGTSPFWIGNNGTGTSTLYDGTGTAVSLVVTIPGPGGTGQGAVTGVIQNPTQLFLSSGKPSSFIFCTEDGVIAGWAPAVNATAAQVLVDNSKSNAVYKACVMAGPTTAPQIYATNFNAGTVDVFDGSFNPVKSATAFVDPAVPAGFAPFGIVLLNGNLYVSYAKQDSAKKEDVGGVGNGYVSVFDLSGNLMTHLVSQGPLNSPWGMAIAPATFGTFANMLLVGNFRDGAINAFDPVKGTAMGALNDTTGKAISIPGLWTLIFGNKGKNVDPNTLYFTAGIAGNGQPIQSHGLMGLLQAAPSFTTAQIENSASFSTTLAPNTWATIFGGELSATVRMWQTSDFVGNKLPTQLNNVGVTINGEAAYVDYVSPTQINFLVPADVAPGPVQIQTTNGPMTSASVNATVAAIAPSFFMFTGNKYIAATHGNGTIAAPASLITGVTSTPVSPGEEIVLYANGLGATTPAIPNGQLLSAPLPLVVSPTIMIGGTSANVLFAGLIEPGLYQINVVVPAGLPAGDAAVTMLLSGSQSQANTFLSIASQ